MEIAEQLVRKRGIPDDHRTMSVSCERIADILRGKGDLSGALKLYQKDMEIREQLIRERGTLDDRRILRISYNKVADILRAQGDHAGAWRCIRRGTEIQEQLVRERGAVSDCDRLATFCGVLAMQSTLPVAERFTYARQGLKLSEQLLKVTGLDRYQNSSEIFRQLIKALEKHNG